MSDKANAASIAIFSENEVLLVKRAHAPMRGYWSLPGGRLETGETEEDAARREIREELALALETLLHVGAHQQGGYRLAVFAARIGSGIPQPSDEIADWQWRAPGDLGTLKTTPGLADIVAAAWKTLTPA